MSAVDEARVDQVLLGMGLPRVHRDSDGDWVMDVWGRRMLARLVERPVPFVHMWAAVAEGVAEECLREVNNVNQRSVLARIAWYAPGEIYVFAQVPVEGLTASLAQQNLAAVASIADDLGPLFEAVYPLQSA